MRLLGSRLCRWRLSVNLEDYGFGEAQADRRGRQDRGNRAGRGSRDGTQWPGAGIDVERLDRRRNIELYLQPHGVEVSEMMEMDAMIGTLEFVARSDWVAILSGLICVNDIDKSDRIINPLFDPPLFAEFIVISRRTLSTQARLFLDAFEAEIARIQEVWASVIPPAVFPETSARPRVNRLRSA